LAADPAAVHQHVAQVPIETEGLGIVLRDFNEFGFDVDLRRRYVEDLNRGLYDVQVLQAGADEQAAFPVVEIDAFAGLTQVHAQGRKEIEDRLLHFEGEIGRGQKPQPTTAAAAADSASLLATTPAALHAARRRGHARDD